jgi:CTP:molybdopterin cytidylyltransferase MocA
VSARVAGLLLAAGEGSRLGRPKALVELGGQTLAERGVALLRAGGTHPVLVVTGAAPLSLAAAHVVHNPDWRTGMGSSLAAGLRALGAAAPASGAPGTGDSTAPLSCHDCQAVVVALADQPLVGANAVRRLIAAWREGATVAVAAYDGKPRNPVLIAREHWDSVLELATGDTGARPFLRANPDLVRLVECGDTGSPYDVDTPEDLARVAGVSAFRSDENSLAPTGR